MRYTSARWEMYIDGVTLYSVCTIMENVKIKKYHYT